MVTVERTLVERVTSVEFPDGRDLVGEAIQYDCSCGCQVIFGVRYKGGAMEKCMLATQCDDHPRLKDRVFEASQAGHKMYDEDTDAVIAWAVLYGGPDGA